MKRKLDSDQTLRFIRGFIQGNAESPTIVEIATRFHVSVTCVHEELTRLEAKGKIARKPNVSRGIALVKK